MARISRHKRHWFVRDIGIYAFFVIRNETGGSRRLVNWREEKNSGGDGEPNKFHEMSP